MQILFILNFMSRAWLCQFTVEKILPAVAVYPKNGFHKSVLFIYLDEFPEEPPSDVVVGLHEDLPEPGLPDRVVLGVELVETVEGVAILDGEINITNILLIKDHTFTENKHTKKNQI